MLPGGRDAHDTAQRAEVEAVWGALPAPGTVAGDSLLAAAADGDFSVLVTAGVEPRDAGSPAKFRAAVEASAFVIAFETRHSEITAAADVVFPVAVVTEKSGSFVNWEGRVQSFTAVEPGSLQLSDARVLADLAAEMGMEFPATSTALRREMQALAVQTPPTVSAPSVAAAATAAGLVLDTWHELLDAGVMQSGEPFLAATARALTARISPTTATQHGVADGDEVAVSTAHGEVTVSLEVRAGMADGVIWLPSNAVGCNPADSLAARAGTAVTVSRVGGAR
ncbi:MAG: hypothetical protein EBU07_20465 [Betaproteobacteria bacterium]|nr:hypothetical protein [Betaproteobacteria bacterium]